MTDHYSEQREAAYDEAQASRSTARLNSASGAQHPTTRLDQLLSQMAENTQTVLDAASQARRSADQLVGLDDRVTADVGTVPTAADEPFIYRLERLIAEQESACREVMMQTSRLQSAEFVS